MSHLPGAVLIGYSYATKRLIDEMDAHFVRLMRNWVKGGAGRYGAGSISSIYSGIAGAGRNESIMPTLTGEVSDVDRALATLPDDEKRAVKLFWINEGNELRWFAARLDCESRAVVRRLTKGHNLLRIELERYRKEQHAWAAANRAISTAISNSIMPDGEYAQPFAREPVDNEKWRV